MLYERDYMKNKSKNIDKTYSNKSERTMSLADFIKKTYQLFAGTLLVGATGAYIGSDIPMVANYYWGFVILEFILIFGLSFSRNKPGLNLAILFAFAFVSGLTLSVIINNFISMGGASTVANAFILSTVAFGGLSMFAMNTDKDFSSMGKMLFITLLIIIVSSLLNVFLLHNTLLQTGIAAISAILFSAFILYDTQNIIKGHYLTPVDGAVALYLDFINLFVSLLQLLNLFDNED